MFPWAFQRALQLLHYDKPEERDRNYFVGAYFPGAILSYIVFSSFSVLHANLLLQSEAKSKVYWTLLLGSLSHFQCQFFLCRVRAHRIQQPNIAEQGCCSSMSPHPTSSKAEQVVLISTVKCINTCLATQVSMSKSRQGSHWQKHQWPLHLSGWSGWKPVSGKCDPSGNWPLDLHLRQQTDTHPGSWVSVDLQAKISLDLDFLVPLVASSSSCLIRTHRYLAQA